MAGCIVVKGPLRATVALRSPVKSAGGCKSKINKSALIAKLRAEGKIVSDCGDSLMVYDQPPAPKK